MRIKVATPYVCMVFFMILTTTAGGTDLCRELSAFTFAPGSYHDGTGIARTPVAMEYLKLELMQKYKADVDAYFTSVLTSSDHVYFNKIVLQSLSIACDPSCEKMLQTGVLAGQPLINAKEKLIQIFFDALLPTRDQLEDMHIQAKGVDNGKKVDPLSFVIHNDVFLTKKDAIRIQIKKDYGIQDTKTILTHLFPQVKSMVAQVMQERVPNLEDQQRMIEKIEAITLKEASCSEVIAPKPKDEITLHDDLILNAAYNGIGNTMVYCDGLHFNNQSLFSMVFILAHEMAHAVDPCMISIGPPAYRFNYTHTADANKAMDEYPIQNVLACLRSEQSMGAMRNDTSTMGVRVISANSDQSQSSDAADGDEQEQDNHTESASKYSLDHSPFCLNNDEGKVDQITEAFADWVGTEVIAHYSQTHLADTLEPMQFKYGYANIFRPMASEGEKVEDKDKKTIPSDSHSEMYRRIDKMILAHPTIRRFMNCPERPETLWYCPKISIKMKRSIQTCKHYKTMPVKLLLKVNKHQEITTVQVSTPNQNNPINQKITKKERSSVAVPR
ncbi:MAG: hypothetical protein R3A45_07745 [Bdellovibrionota bacterium]